VFHKRDSGSLTDHHQQSQQVCDLTSDEDSSAATCSSLHSSMNNLWAVRYKQMSL